MGLPALYKDDGCGDGSEHDLDLLALVNGASQLLELYQGTIAKLSDMETEEMRRAGELDYLRARQGKLKVRAAPGSFPDGPVQIVILQDLLVPEATSKWHSLLAWDTIP